MNTLFFEKNEFLFIGNSYALKNTIDKNRVRVYKNGNFVKENLIYPAIEKRLFVVDLVERHGVKKSKLATALNISRQSIDNWIAIYRKHGSVGLINNTKDSWKKNPKSFTGNKARQLEEQRQAERQYIENQELTINFEQEIQTEEKYCEDANKLYQEEFDYKENRYAGSLLYLSVLISSFRFFKQLSTHVGQYLWVPFLFVMMQVNNIPSVEQLKTLFKEEFGKILGIKRLPNLAQVREDIHDLIQLKLSAKAKKLFYKTQVIKGIVSIWRIFLDGHFVPYSGNSKVHKAHCTQRDMMMPGQTEFFGHDSKGNIVYFDIQEGQGNMVESLQNISEMYQKYNDDIPPLIVVDRELWGVNKFLSLSACRFVTWEKNTNKKALRSLSDELFKHELTLNNKSYTLFETNRVYKSNTGTSIELRRIISRNIKTGETFAIITNDNEEDTVTIAESMLNRWGCSENGFKHLGTRINMHYNPTLQTSEESQKQNIQNPEYKKLKKKEKSLKTQLSKIQKELGKKEPSLKKDGTPRKSEKREKTIQRREQLENELSQIKDVISECAEYIDLKQTDNETFKTIDKEGKNWWNIAEMIFWNSRKKLSNMLYSYLQDKRDLLPVLDAITSSKGWIKSTKDTLIVRIEPLETLRFKSAQVQLCRYLNSKKIHLPNGKLLQYDVAANPYNVQK